MLVQVYSYIRSVFTETILLTLLLSTPQSEASKLTRRSLFIPTESYSFFFILFFVCVRVHVE